MNRFSNLVQAIKKRFTSPITIETARDIMEGLYIPSVKIDPSDCPYAFDYNNIEYCIIDDYCLNPRCNCTDFLLTFFDTTYIDNKNKRKNTKVLTVSYDYQTEKMTIIESRISKHKTNILWNNFLSTEDSLLPIFTARHAKYRNLADKWVPRIVKKTLKQYKREFAKVSNEADEIWKPHPLLLSFAASNNIDKEKLLEMLHTSKKELPEITDRHDIILHDGDKTYTWHVKRLSDLYRGDIQPVSFDEMSMYPAKYQTFFYNIERDVVLCNLMDRIPTDKEFNDAYSAIRRRPDGKSNGYLHDLIWQATCIALATHPWSEKETEAILRQLARSCRTFKLSTSSRNYMGYVTNLFAE